MPDIAQKYLKNRPEHDKLAREWTTKYAMSNKKKLIVGSSSASGSGSGSGTGTGAKGEVEVIVID